MNCDHAFDLMTSLDGLSDPALARHLSECPRCRHMQDTLSPALEWFSSDITEPWSMSNSGVATTTPLLSVQAMRVAEEAARDLSYRRNSRGWRRTLVMAAMLMAGAALGVAAYDVHRPASTPPVPSTTGLMTACLWNDPALRARMPDASAQSVVASCVMCHVPHSVR